MQMQQRSVLIHCSTPKHYQAMGVFEAVCKQPSQHVVVSDVGVVVERKKKTLIFLPQLGGLDIKNVHPIN
jgi:hypothetical protein